MRIVLNLRVIQAVNNRPYNKKFTGNNGKAKAPDLRQSGAFNIA